MTSQPVRTRWSSAAEPDEVELGLWEEFAATGSASAREGLFAMHLPFARNMARRQVLDRRSGDIEFQDLYQLACVGLLQAIDHYKPGIGVPFRGYARRRIVGSIIDGISIMSEVREQISFRNRVRRERTRSLCAEGAEDLGLEESLHALAELAVGLALGFMLEGTGLYQQPDAVDHLPSPYGSLAWKECLARLSDAVSTLPEREQRLIGYHYCDGLTFDQIGSLFGVSKGRISQMHKAVLGLLRKRLSSSSHLRLQL